MSGTLNIQYLTNRQIDKTRWDKCINTADNGLVYAYSFYLDHMAKHWDALVLSKGVHSESEYEMVMPLTWNRKYGVNYLYQPFLTAQLGIFGKQVTEHQVSHFIHAMPTSFRLIEISLNHGNIHGVPSHFSVNRSNYVLNMQKPYEELYKNFKENTRRNIKKAMQSGCTVQKNFDVEKVIELALVQMKEYSKESGENVDRFRGLYKDLHSRQMATTYGIVSEKKELLSSCVFFFSHNRAYYILVGNHPDSKTMGASHSLIDAFIKEQAGKKMSLDFEGSDIGSLALFYNSFGASEEIYPALKINRLPFYMKWLKR